MTYLEILENKLETWVPCGIEIEEANLHPSLFAFQRSIVLWACRMGRAAIFADCGLGKTRLQLEWLRMVVGDGIGIIFAPLTVADQTIEEANSIGIRVAYAKDFNDVRIPGIYITNYERANRFDGIDFRAVVLDESSILKNFTGSTRNLLIDRFRGTPYRLACTATPAPNDITEMANHAEFLGVKSRVEMLATFFVNDGKEWRLKGHATKEFFRWLASWSVYLRTPSDIGYDDSSYVLPELMVRDEVVASEVIPEGFLIPIERTVGVAGRSKLRRETLSIRVRRVVEIVSSPGQWVIWVGLNNESEAIKAAIPDAVTVEGSDSDIARAAAIKAFRSGKARILISKPKVSGFGLNFQHCHQMVFCGINDSWEQYYQAIRRCWRFGQQHPVDVRIVTASRESAIADNIKKKEIQAMQMGQELISHMGELGVNLLQPREISPPVRSYANGRGWELWNGDSAEVLYDIPSDSVDLSVYSPPFATLFTYSDDIRDMGNNVSHEAFFAQFQFVIEGLLRVTKPGRITCVHVQQLTTRKGTDGHIGLIDFRGACIEAYKRAGWQHFGEVAVDKCPQAQAIRTKAHSLMFVTLNKDRSNSRPGLADFVLLFKRPGENIVPILSSEVTNDLWIEWARPIWYGVRESNTLNTKAAKSEKDERHICPLQLDLIERCIKMWSNPGEHVLSPFAGIGSEGYEAIRHGRTFTGIELKTEYFNQAKINLARAEHMVHDELTLFDVPTASLLSPEASYEP